MAIGSGDVVDEDLLKGALRHLYDPSYLRKSPLVGLLRLAHEPNPADALRTALERCIDALKPGAGRPSGPQGDRHYRILYYRYVQQFPPRDVAHQLGISLRHLRREQASAVESLAEALRSTIARAHEEEADDVTPNASQDLAREMDWVEDTFSDEVTEVAPVIEEALRVVGPLAERHGILLQASVGADLSPIAAGRTVFKEVIITLVTAMLDGADGGRVDLAADLEAEHVLLRFASTRATAHGPAPLDEEALDMAHRLVDLSAGTLRVSATGTGWAASVTLPTVEQVMVLAIEDNVDTLQLWERYLQGTRFHLVRAGPPNAALATAIELQPAIIVLDVMMPGIDGWDLLMQLRNHIQTAAIPVVVCTVLPHGELALSLGAADFIRKPVTRESFRAALERGIAAATRQ
jgi:CheY-like chemotaxis protein